MITKDEALADLREIFPVDTEVRTILRHASRSGMTRTISVISPGLRDVSYLVSRVTGFKMDPKHEGLKVGGFEPVRCPLAPFPLGAFFYHFR